jgi:L-lactate dehydrogenase complex protein LldE
VKIALFIPCLTDQFHPRAGEAVVRVLEALGHEVFYPEDQTCCGQAMYNNGARDEAAALMLRMARVFGSALDAGCGAVVTPSASCAAMVKVHGPELFGHEDPRAAGVRRLAAATHEFTAFLAEVLGFDARSLRLRLERETTATVHVPCHQRPLGKPRVAEVLDGIGGLRVVPMPHAEECCGFGGAFAVKHPEISGPMALGKAADVSASGAGTLVCGDAGCAMNIEGACRRAGVRVRVVHPAEILAEAMGLMPVPGDREGVSA